MPMSGLNELAIFLEQYDCLKDSEPGLCYQLTRIRLIEATRISDEALAENWAAKQTINQLIKNINGIIDGLNEHTLLPVKK